MSESRPPGGPVPPAPPTIETREEREQATLELARQLVARGLPLTVTSPERPRSRIPWEVGSIVVAVLALVGWIYSAGQNSQKVSDLSESVKHSEQQLIDRLNQMEKQSSVQHADLKAAIHELRIDIKDLSKSVFDLRQAPERKR